jgi:tetratricopeptide (TPR) repeat protein
LPRKQKFTKLTLMSTQLQIRRWPVALVAALVALLTFAQYWQTRTFEHVRLDDGVYALSNPMVENGLTREGVRWAFTNRETGNLHPLTWLSLMLDGELFGVNIGAMHLHNALLHAVAAALLFLLLARLAGRREDGTAGARASAPCPSAVSAVPLAAAAIAALFWSLHPLRAESVAWVSSRKDVLSGVFCMLGLLAWLADVRAHYGGAPRYEGWRVFSGVTGAVVPSVGGRNSFWMAWVCFVLGYGAKPTMMIFPGLLALVEWLEAGRVRWKPLALMGVLVIGFGALTVYAQEIAIMADISPTTRVFNGVVSYATYWRQTFLPVNLCIFYPYGLNLTYWRIAVGMFSLVVSLAAALWCWRRMPVVSFMLGWFVCGLVPVIGIIHVGIAGHADRYTYLPSLGVSVCLAALLARRQAGGAALRVAATALLSGYAVAGHRTIATWRNNYTVFSQAVRAEPRSAKAWQQLGAEHANRMRDPDEGIACYRRALSFHATDECAGQLALALALRGKPGDFDEVKRLTTRVADEPALDAFGGALTALGVVAMRELRWEDAVRYLSIPAASKPTPELHVWLGMSLYQAGRVGEAAQVFRRVAETAPDEDARREGRKRLDYILAKHGDIGSTTTKQGEKR